MKTDATRRFALCAVLLTALVACGSDDEAPAASAPAAPTASAASSASPGEVAKTSSTPAATPEATTVPTDSPSAADTASAAAAAATSAAAAESPAAPAGKGGSPCDLLTEAEVATAIEAKAVKAEFTDHGEPLGGKQCVWSTDSVPLKTYSLTINRTEDMAKVLRDSGQSAKVLYENSKPLFPGAKPIEGIGDEAVTAKSTILARKGDAFISATTIFGTSPMAIAALKLLTTKAVAQL